MVSSIVAPVFIILISLFIFEHIITAFVVTADFIWDAVNEADFTND